MNDLPWIKYRTDRMYLEQTVNKAALNFQTKGGLPPRNGQRDEAARANMSEQRKAQLRNP